MYMWLVWGLQLLAHVSLLEDVGGLRCKSQALLVKVIGTGVALGIGVGAALISHFLKKQRFLSVILPDPTTLIQYWQSGRTMTIFPVVFHWRLSGLRIATVSPTCYEQRLWIYYLHTFPNS